MADNQNNQDAVTPKNQLKAWWVTGSKPSQAQYYLWMDAYWHKSESIPPSSITGLGGLLEKKADADQLAYYAKTDASNIDIDTWKEVLGVGALPENVGTIDFTNSEGFSYVGNAYKKVDNPNDGNVYVLNIDGTKVNANTFGKNIANADLTTSGSFVHTQLAEHSFEWKTQGASYKISGLPDKSADASYDEFIGRNSEGRLAKVGYPAFNKAFSSLSATEALILSQLLNGSTGGGGAINVNLISPPIIQNQYDTDEYVLLRGVNLNLNPTSMSIQILDSNQTTVVATIPNNQIQLSANGLELVFYYNFHNFVVGTYFIKITSGVKTYITTLDLKVVESVENINLSAITWDLKYAPGVTPNGSNGLGPNVTFKSILSNVVDTTPKLSLKSSELFDQGENFYLEMKASISPMVGQDIATNVESPNYIGLGYSGVENSMNLSSLVYYWYRFGGGRQAEVWDNMGSIFGAPADKTIIIIKTGNLFRIIVGGFNNSFTLSNNMGYSIFLQVVGRSAVETTQVQIVKAFKFN